MKFFVMKGETLPQVDVVYRTSPSAVWSFSRHETRKRSSNRDGVSGDGRFF